MRENMLLNDNSNGIKVIPEAVSNNVGYCGLTRGWGGKITSTGTTKMTTINQFISDEKILNVFLIKLDIQGEELNALKGAVGSFNKIENFILESHTAELHNKCENLLVLNGYKLSYSNFEVGDQPSGLIVASKSS